MKPCFRLFGHESSGSGKERLRQAILQMTMRYSSMYNTYWHKLSSVHDSLQEVSRVHLPIEPSPINSMAERLMSPLSSNTLWSVVANASPLRTLSYVQVAFGLSSASFLRRLITFSSGRIRTF